MIIPASGSGTATPSVATDDVGGNHYQRVKLDVGGDGLTVPVVGTLPVSDGAGSLTIDSAQLPAALVGGRLSVDASGVAVPVTDNGGSLTVDGAVTANVGTTNGLALDATLTNATQKTKLVDTGGTNVASVSAANALKVDGSAVTQPVSGTFFQATQPVSVAATVTVDSELTTADLDTGGGTDTRAVVGLVIAKSGGAANISATDPLPISDAGGSITVDGTVSIPANSSVNVAQVAGTTTDTNSGSKSAGTQRVVLATDQPQLTNALKVDGSAVTQPVSGTVAVSAVTPGTGATNLGKVEDAAHASGDVGVLTLAVRRDANTTLVDTDGDNAPLQVDANGALKVTGGGGGTQYIEDAASAGGETGTVLLGVRRDANTTPVSADGDFHTPLFDAIGGLKVSIIAGAGSGGTAIADDAAFTVATTQVTPAGYMADEVTPDSVDEGDIGVGRMSLNRNQYVQLRDISAERSAAVTAANALKTDGSAVTQPVSGTVSANAGTGPWPVTDNAGSLTVDSAQLPAALVGGRLDVVVGAALPAGTNNIGDVDVLTLPNVTNAGTFAVQDSEKLVDNAAFTDGTTKVQPIGYIFDEAAGTALTENDIAAARLNANRAQVLTIEDDATRGRRLTITAANAAKVDGSAVTQPVSGTVTANAGTGPFPVSDNAGSLTVDAPVGTPVFARLSDGAAALTTTGGRLSVDASGVAVPITDNAGSLTVDNAGTFAVQDSQVITDNAAFTDGTSKLSMAGYIFDEVAGTALTENDSAAARVNANRAVVGAIEDGATRARYATVSAANALKVDGSAVTQPVSGTFWQATQPVSGTVTANAGTGPFPVSDNAGSLTVDAPVGTPVAARLSDGAAFYDAAKTGQLPGALVSSRLDVNLGATGAGVVIENVGDIAHDAAASAVNPILVGGYASATAPTDVSADTDSVRAWLLRNGAQVGAAAQTAASTAAWTSATAIDTTLSVNVVGYAAGLITINPTSTFTAGAIIFEGSDDAGTTWYPIVAARQDSPTVEGSYTIVANTKRIWSIDVVGLTNMRVRLNPAITGTGTLNVRMQASAASSEPSVVAMTPTGGGKTLLFASVSTAASGQTAIVTADANNKIKVVSYVLVADAAVTAKWQRASTDLTGAMSLAANGGVSAIGAMSAHLFETALNEALNINLGAAIGVRGHIAYYKESL